ncbi:alpha-amylase family glycosyl hydrolase [Kyrpidia spormannii]
MARPWSTNGCAGFKKGTSWIKVNPNYTSINVKTALSDPNSITH